MKVLFPLIFLVAGCLDTSVGQCIAGKRNHIGPRILGYSEKVVYEEGTKFATVQTDPAKSYYYGTPEVESKLNPFTLMYYDNVPCPAGKADAPPYAPDMYKDLIK